ncbi:uroporphyrinogen decarboxylase family protein [Staphylococcus aureus]
MSRITDVTLNHICIFLLISEVKEKHDVPVILFGVGASHLINEWNDLPIDVLGLDWRTSN